MTAEREDRIVPLLITADIETAWDHDLCQQDQILCRLGSDLTSLGIPTTLFPTAESAERFSAPLKRMNKQGHELGCHGIDHRHDEDYSKFSFAESVSMIGRSIEIIEKAIDSRPVSFRAPRMSSSPELQDALEKHGFIMDFSMSPQRFDFFNSSGAPFSSLFAPRYPYHPSRRSPFRKGDRKLLVVPLSCIGIPFLSGSLFLFGLAAMKILFRTLLIEAKRQRSPIVYLFHSYEFANYTGAHTGNNGPFPPVYAEKRKALHRLYVRDRKRRYEETLDLFRYILSFRSVRPMTAHDYYVSNNNRGSGN